jgi:hypothetical protein
MVCSSSFLLAGHGSVVLRWVRWGRLVDFGGVDDGGILLVAAHIIYGEVAFGAFLLLVVKIW